VGEVKGKSNASKKIKAGEEKRKEKEKVFVESGGFSVGR
jgi:hypothetical protein